MKRPLLAAALALLSGATVAQTTVTTTGTASDTVEIAPEPRTVIKKDVTEQHAKPVRLEERVTVGSTVPADVDFQPLPSTVVTTDPRLKGYSYFLSDGGTYIVDPGSRRVITTIDCVDAAGAMESRGPGPFPGDEFPMAIKAWIAPLLLAVLSMIL